MRVWAKWSAWLCLSLMLWTAAAESTHNHPLRTGSFSCSICVVAHSASPTVNSSQATPVFAAVSLLRDEAVIAKVQFDFSELGSRGPPVL
jgi:hypothetical protein